MTRSASWRRRSIECASDSRSSTTHGRSSSPTRRTSSVRRCSPSAGFLELLTDEELDEKTRDEFLATMRSQVERLTKLSTDLLDLSRMDAGQLRVEREPVDLSSVVSDARSRSSSMSRRRPGTCWTPSATGARGARRTRSGCCRSAARWSSTASCTRPRARGWSCGRAGAGAVPSSRSPTTGRAFRPRSERRSSSVSTGSRAVSRREAGSVWRSHARSRASWTAACGSSRARDERSSRSIFPERSRSSRPRSGADRFHVKTVAARG